MSTDDFKEIETLTFNAIKGETLKTAKKNAELYFTGIEKSLIKREMLRLQRTLNTGFKSDAEIHDLTISILKKL